MKRFLAAILLFSITACKDEGQSAHIESSTVYEETKKSLKEVEKENPLKFLKLEGTYRQNLIGQWVLEGEISNTASVASYKNAVLEITYLTKTDTELGSMQKVIYEYFEPSSSKTFKIKLSNVRDADRVNYRLVAAE